MQLYFNQRFIKNNRSKTVDCLGVKMASIRTAGKSIINFIQLSSLLSKYCKMWKILSRKACEFCIYFYYARKSSTTMWTSCNAFSRVMQKYSCKIHKLYITVFSTFYNILQPDFTIFLNLNFTKCATNFFRI